MPIAPVTTEFDLDSALASSLVVIVKDSPRCIQCAAARRQLRKLEKHQAKLGRPIDLLLLNVLEHRGLSDRLGRHFGVRHESPQAFVVRNGELVWSGDHFAITWRKLAAQLAAADGTSSAASSATPMRPR